jgi:Uma2 family endonuclease
MNVVLREQWTVDRFLAWEDRQEGRFEFDGERVRDVTGGSRAHQRIVMNLMRLLEDTLDPARFDAVQEMRLQIGDKIRYPDVAIVAGPVPGSTRSLHDAVVLFEIVSDDSAAVDRVQKRAEYALLPSLRRYVILEQTHPAASILTRTPREWEEAASAEQVDLPEVGASLPLSAVYRGTRPSIG